MNAILKVLLPIDPNTGLVDLAATDALLATDQSIRAVCISWIPTNGGAVQPAEAIGALVEKHDRLYLLDACQAVRFQQPKPPSHKPTLSICLPLYQPACTDMI